MSPTLATSSKGTPTLKWGEEFLEDPVDPEVAATQFVQPQQLEGVSYVVLFGAGLGYRIQRLEQLGIRNILVFEPSEEIALLTKEVAADRVKSAKLFTDVLPILSILISQLSPKDRLTMLAPPAYKRAFAEEHQRLVDALKDLKGFVHLRRNSSVQRSRASLDAALTNLPWLARMPSISQLANPLEGQPAFIVSAGPSLDVNAHLLSQASEKGTIFTVNTAAPVFSKNNARIDMLVAIETVNVAYMFEQHLANTECLALDLSCHSELFALRPEKSLGFIKSASPYNWLAQQLDVTTLTYGASVATAAFGLAYLWGANPIVVLGQDLAFTGGRVYAAGTAHDSLRAEPRGNVLLVDSTPERDALFTQSGIKPPPRARPRLEVKGWGGGTVDTVHAFTLFRRWFESMAYQYGKQRRFINASEGGASIERFEELHLSKVLESLPQRPKHLPALIREAKPLAVEVVNTLRTNIHTSAETLAKCARECMRAKTTSALDRAHTNLREAAKRAKIADAYAFPELTEIREDTSIPHKERAERTYKAILNSSLRVAELTA